MKRLFLSLLFLMAPGLCIGQAITPAQQNGPTVPFTANVSGSIPNPVQAASDASFSQQYLITNVGSVVAFVSHASTSALATTRCIVPIGSAASVSIPTLPLSAYVVTDVPNAFFCGITSSGTAVIYVTPVVGN